MQVMFRSWLRALATWILLPAITVCQVPQSAPTPSQQSSPQLDRHARRIQKTLASYPAGTTIQIELRDHTTRFGDLGALSPESFELLDHHSHVPTTYAYSDVAHAVRAASVSPNRVVFHPHRGVTHYVLLGVIAGLIIVPIIILVSTRD